MSTIEACTRPPRGIRPVGIGSLSALLAVALAPASAEPPARNDGREWRTLHGDPVRSGFYPQFPKGPLRPIWRQELWRELIGARCEVIVADGRAYIGTAAGNLYAFDAATGDKKWVLSTGGPIPHSPSFDRGVVFAGSMDRRLYAVHAADGSVKWTFEADEGICVSPAVHAGLVLFGDRGGTFRAVRAADGRPAWSVKTDAPILGTASITDDGSAAVFASEDMHVYCVELAGGRLRWKSRKMAGLSARDHAPTIVGGLAIVTTNPVRDFHRDVLNAHEDMLVKRTGFVGKDRRYIPGTAEDHAREQDAIVEFLKADPSQQTFYAFRLSDGRQPWIAPILYTAGLHNPHTPPCFNPTTGEVFVITRSAYSVWDGGGEVRAFTAVGRLDLKTGRVALIEHGHKSKEPGRPAGAKDMPWMSFNLIGDETQTLSCSADTLFSNHQGTIGTMDLKTGLCRAVYGKRDSYGGFYGPAEWGWENQGGYEKARKAGRPFGLVNEWHGPAKSIASVAGEYVYYCTGSQVMCLAGTGR